MAGRARGLGKPVQPAPARAYLEHERVTITDAERKEARQALVYEKALKLVGFHAGELSVQSNLSGE